MDVGNEVNLLNTDTLLLSDIGMLDKNNHAQIKSFLKITRFEIPKNISKDATNRRSPYRLLYRKLTNSESCDRDWICWSFQNQSIYCAPCYIFNNSKPFSYLTDKFGYNIKNGWKNLSSGYHLMKTLFCIRKCIFLLKNAQKADLADLGLDSLLINTIENETTYWKNLLKRFLDIIFFLSERGLPFLDLMSALGIQIREIFLA